MGVPQYNLYVVMQYNLYLNFRCKNEYGIKKNNIPHPKKGT